MRWHGACYRFRRGVLARYTVCQPRASDGSRLLGPLDGNGPALPRLCPGPWRCQCAAKGHWGWDKMANDIWRVLGDVSLFAGVWGCALRGGVVRCGLFEIDDAQLWPRGAKFFDLAGLYVGTGQVEVLERIERCKPV